MRTWDRAQAGRTARWLWWTALSFPVAVLSHELGHYAAYRCFGLQAPALHYDSASFAGNGEFWHRMRSGDIAAATELVPPWQAGVGAAAGLLASYAAVVACVLVARRRPHPFVVGLGLIAPLRFLGSVFILGAMLLGRGRDFGSDEEHVAMTLHVPALPLHLLGIAMLVVAWVVLLRIPSRHAKWGKTAVLAGMVLGGSLYIGVVGPWLLP